MLSAIVARMSAELDRPVISKPKKHRKSEKEEKSEKKSEKKRKREVAEGESELPFPKKKKQKHSEPQPKPERQAQSPPGPTPTPKTSPFYTQTSSLYLPLAPIAQAHPLSALCAEHVSPLLLSYYPPFHGVLISYSDPRLSSKPHDIYTGDGRQKAFARSVDEYAATFVWLIAEFLVFRPQSGDVIEGYINLQSESSIGIIYWNYFNASIERSNLPRKWTWIPGGMAARGSRGSWKSKQKKSGGAGLRDDTVEEKQGRETQDLGVEDDLGYWQDEDGKKVEGLVKFYVKDVDTSRSADRENGFIGIAGSIIEPRVDHDRAGALTNGSGFLKRRPT